jgi:hypothetical protein
LNVVAYRRAIEDKRGTGLVNKPRGAKKIALGLLFRGSMPRLIAAGLLLAVAIATTIVSVTGAMFTDTQSVGANTFSTGTIDISTSPATALVTYSGMVPGDKVTNPITVSNDGSLEFRYAIQSTTTEDVLAAALDMTIKTGVTTCTNAGFDTDGSTISGPGDLGSTTGLNVVGDPTAGQDAGDRVLAALANEVLCFQVSLPLSADGSVQGLTTTATFDFASEQTANNP